MLASISKAWQAAARTMAALSRGGSVGLMTRSSFFATTARSMVRGLRCEKGALDELPISATPRRHLALSNARTVRRCCAPHRAPPVSPRPPDTCGRHVRETQRLRPTTPRQYHEYRDTERGVHDHRRTWSFWVAIRRVRYGRLYSCKCRRAAVRILRTLREDWINYRKGRFGGAS